MNLSGQICADTSIYRCDLLTFYWLQPIRCIHQCKKRDRFSNKNFEIEKNWIGHACENVMKKITDKNLRSASIDSDTALLFLDSRKTIPDCAVNLRYKLRFSNKSANQIHIQLRKWRTFFSNFFEKSEKYLEFVLKIAQKIDYFFQWFQAKANNWHSEFQSNNGFHFGTAGIEIRTTKISQNYCWNYSMSVPQMAQQIEIVSFAVA